MALNKVMLIGNLGKEPEVRHLDSGIAVASFSIATTERYKDKATGEQKENTEWHNVICWRRLAEIVEQYVHKGSQIFIEGKLRTRSYHDRKNQDIVRYTTEVVADNIQLLGGRTQEARKPQVINTPQQSTQQAYQQTGAEPYPF